MSLDKTIGNLLTLDMIGLYIVVAILAVIAYAVNNPKETKKFLMGVYDWYKKRKQEPISTKNEGEKHDRKKQISNQDQEKENN